MLDDILIHENLIIPRNELELSFAKSGGPGGQNVNKLNTKVYLRWHFSESKLEKTLLDRFSIYFQSSITEKGDILVCSERFRTQEKNLTDCIEKFQAMLQAALVVPKERKKKKMPRAVKEKRLQGKKQNSRKKKNRCRVSED